MTDPEGPGDPQPQGERDDEPELDIDSAFAAIIADFSLPVPHGVGPWPAAEDIDDEDDEDAPDAGPVTGGADAGPDAGPGAAGTTRRPPGPADLGVPPAVGPAVAGPAGIGPAAVGPAPAEPWRPPARRISVPGDDLRREVGPGGGVRGDDDDDDEGYQPPEPPPLPRGDLVSRLAWGAVLGGPLFLLVAALLWRSLPTYLLLLALIAFVGGFVTLVARMPQEHPDDPDDGAVV